MKCGNNSSRNLSKLFLAVFVAFSVIGRAFLVVADSGDIFVDSGQRLGSSVSNAVALGDLDGDGDLDAFVGNQNYQPNTVWLNDGMGNFTDSGQSLGNLDSRAVSLGDLDGDGDLDAFVGNDDGLTNIVWLNDGTGVFTDSGQRLGRSRSLALALGDLDGDGDLDAFVGNIECQANKVWLNDGMGNFTDSGQSLGSSDSEAVGLGDLDGDGDLDAFVGNYNEPDKVWLNDGMGNFTDSGQSLGSSRSLDVAIGDVDGDGDLDAFVANAGPPPGQAMANKVWLNNGVGVFTDSGQNLNSVECSAVAMGDVDGDGDLDAFTGNGVYSGKPNKVWLNDSTGIFGDSGQSLGSGVSRAVALGDLDGDGDLDAFVTNMSGGNEVWLNIYCPPNSPPTADAGGPYSVGEGGSIVVSASGSDPDGDPLTYAWDLDNDGTFETPGQSVTFSAVEFDGPSSHNIAVQVTDSGGLSATDQTTVEVLNVAPTAIFTNTTGTIIEGQAATLAFNNQSDPGVDDSTAGFSYSYDCTDDGAFELTDASVTSFVCDYPDSGTFTARGRIKDKDGDFTDYTVGVAVLTPAEGIQDLTDTVDEFNLQQGIDNSLDAKLGAALQALNDLNQNNDVAAMNSLQAFINAVEAQRGNKITDEQADELVEKAQAIISSLS